MRAVQCGHHIDRCARCRGAVQWQNAINISSACARVCSEREGDDVRRGRFSSQPLGTDFEHNGKNSAMWTSENKLPIKAKARLCVQGQMDAGTLSGASSWVHRRCSGCRKHHQQRACALRCHAAALVAHPLR